MFLAVLSSAYCEEKLEDGSERVVMKIHPKLAPIKAAILPLLPKDGLDELAYQISGDLRKDLYCVYDEKDSIGKRYRRQDAIGTPFCITIDHQSKEDNTVTLRERDSMNQKRISIAELKQILKESIAL
jgi:glycyl-tRNA synthetase